MIGRAVQCAPLCVGWTITSCSCATGTLRVYFPYVGRLTPVSSVWVRVVHLEFTILGKRLGNGRRMISTIDCGLAVDLSRRCARARARVVSNFDFARCIMRVDVVLASWSRPPGPRGRGQLAVAGRCERATQRRAPGPEGARPRALLSTPYLRLYRSREHGPAIRL
jgi:hypothetical protein